MIDMFGKKALFGLFVLFAGLFLINSVFSGDVICTDNYNLSNGACMFTDDGVMINSKYNLNKWWDVDFTLNLNGVDLDIAFDSEFEIFGSNRDVLIKTSYKGVDDELKYTLLPQLRLPIKEIYFKFNNIDLAKLYVVGDDKLRKIYVFPLINENIVDDSQTTQTKNYCPGYFAYGIDGLSIKCVAPGKLDFCYDDGIKGEIYSNIRFTDMTSPLDVSGVLVPHTLPLDQIDPSCKLDGATPNAGAVTTNAIENTIPTCTENMPDLSPCQIVFKKGTWDTWEDKLISYVVPDNYCINQTTASSAKTGVVNRVCGGKITISAEKLSIWHSFVDDVEFNTNYITQTYSESDTSYVSLNLDSSSDNVEATILDRTLIKATWKSNTENTKIGIITIYPEDVWDQPLVSNTDGTSQSNQPVGVILEGNCKDFLKSYDGQDYTFRCDGPGDIRECYIPTGEIKFGTYDSLNGKNNVHFGDLTYSTDLTYIFGCVDSNTNSSDTADGAESVTDGNNVSGVTTLKTENCLEKDGWKLRSVPNDKAYVWQCVGKDKVKSCKLKDGSVGKDLVIADVWMGDTEPKKSQREYFISECSKDQQSNANITPQQKSFWDKFWKLFFDGLLGEKKNLTNFVAPAPGVATKNCPLDHSDKQENNLCYNCLSTTQVDILNTSTSKTELKNIAELGNAIKGIISPICQDKFSSPAQPIVTSKNKTIVVNGKNVIMKPIDPMNLESYNNKLKGNNDWNFKFQNNSDRLDVYGINESKLYRPFDLTSKKILATQLLIDNTQKYGTKIDGDLIYGCFEENKVKKVWLTKSNWKNYWIYNSKEEANNDTDLTPTEIQIINQACFKDDSIVANAATTINNCDSNIFIYPLRFVNNGTTELIFLSQSKTKACVASTGKLLLDSQMHELKNFETMNGYVLTDFEMFDPLNYPQGYNLLYFNNNLIYGWKNQYYDYSNISRKQNTQMIVINESDSSGLTSYVLNRSSKSPLVDNLVELGAEVDCGSGNKVKLTNENKELIYDNLDVFCGVSPQANVTDKCDPTKYDYSVNKTNIKYNCTAENKITACFPDATPEHTLLFLSADGQNIFDNTKSDDSRKDIYDDAKIKCGWGDFPTNTCPTDLLDHGFVKHTANPIIKNIWVKCFDNKALYCDSSNSNGVESIELTLTRQDAVKTGIIDYCNSICTSDYEFNWASFYGLYKCTDSENKIKVCLLGDYQGKKEDIEFVIAKDREDKDSIQIKVNNNLDLTYFEDSVSLDQNYRGAVKNCKWTNILTPNKTVVNTTKTVADCPTDYQDYFYNNVCFKCVKYENGDWFVKRLYLSTPPAYGDKLDPVKELPDLHNSLENFNLSTDGVALRNACCAVTPDLPGKNGADCVAVAPTTLQLPPSVFLNGAPTGSEVDYLGKQINCESATNTNKLIIGVKNSTMSSTYYKLSDFPNNNQKKDIFDQVCIPAYLEKGYRSIVNWQEYYVYCANNNTRLSIIKFNLDDYAKTQIITYATVDELRTKLSNLSGLADAALSSCNSSIANADLMNDQQEYLAINIPDHDITDFETNIIAKGQTASLAGGAKAPILDYLLPKINQPLVNTTAVNNLFYNSYLLKNNFGMNRTKYGFVVIHDGGSWNWCNTRYINGKKQTISANASDICAVDSTLQMWSPLEVSSHYYIGCSGITFKLLPENVVAFHAGCNAANSLCRFPGINSVSIGVDLRDCTKYNSLLGINAPYTAEQENALNDLLLDFENRGMIKEISDKTVIGHFEVTLAKNDPLPGFVWTMLGDDITDHRMYLQRKTPFYLATLPKTSTSSNIG